MIIKTIKEPKLKKPKDIRKLRNGLGLTRKEFGEKLGVSDRTIESWEYGYRIPSKSAQILMNRLKPAKKKVIKK